MHGGIQSVESVTLVAASSSILPLQAHEDPDRELASALIDMLFPEQLTVEDLLPLLGVRLLSENLIGGLWSAVRRLPERASVAGLPALLDWLGSRRLTSALEAKLVGDAALETSLLQQLDDKYLVPTGLTHGI